MFSTKIYFIIFISLITLILLLFLIKNSLNKEDFYNSDSLDKICIEYSLDKASTFHNYAVYYDEMLTPFRNKKVKMIEIGIGTWEEGDSTMKYHWKDETDEKKKNYKPGNSLRVWKKYFNNIDYILGIDVKEDCMFSEPNIKTELLDSTVQSNGNIIKEKYGDNFDIILDDGLHSIEAQVKTFITFWPLLKQGGIYLIEDIANPNELKSELNKHTSKDIVIYTCDIEKSPDSYIIKIVK